LRPRYSPGFGDVPLAVQKTFFEILECQKNLALTLNDSLIMSPEKSVTAFVGVYK
jgi:cobalamin-dependent methionine synthase I